MIKSALLLETNILEIHYWFNDNSHSMDAFIENKSENEFLNIVKEIAKIYSLSLNVETEPSAEGGLRKWFKIVSTDENKKATITSAVIIGLITVILTTPISKLSEKIIDNIFEDKELLDLEKEKLKLEIEKLKQEIGNKEVQIENSNIIRKRKSNFYEVLDSYPKIKKVSFSLTDEDKNIHQEKHVPRNDFKKFILSSDDLDPIEKDEAIIEIISPVLKKGKYKWLGYYNGSPISFSMKSTEFKSLVQRGEIEFKNGSSINCLLSIKRKMNNEGEEREVAYDVLRVNHYFQNDKPIETKEGKRFRQTKEANLSQTSIFDLLEESNE